jgi:hypothetical protein
MALLGLFAWVLTLTREFTHIWTFSSAAYLLLGDETHICVDGEDGRLKIVSLSKARLAWTLSIQVMRFAISGLLLVYGLMYIAYTDKVGDLFLNCVALEFVIQFDELIYEAACPAAIMMLCNRLKPLKLPVRHARGAIGLRAILTWVLVLAVTIIAKIAILDPQVQLMVRARDALCAGDVQFVYAIDGAGTIVWGYPEEAQNDPQFGNKTFIRNFPDGELPTKTTGVESVSRSTSYSHAVVDLLLRQQGRAHWHCPPEECYDFQDKQAPLPNRPDCCLARKLRTHTVDVGIFSLRDRANQGTDEAATLWNKQCSDYLDYAFTGGRLDIIQNAVADAFRPETTDKHVHDERRDISCLPPPVGTFPGCPLERPLCKDGKCMKPRCEHLKDYCTKSSVLGVRARQFCPNVCGCSDPRSPLALFMPESGCPRSCLRSGAYLARRQALPCEDVSKTDPSFVAYLDNLDRIRLSWPLDFEAAPKWDIVMLRAFGCAYLRNETFPLGEGPPPYRFGYNLCGENTVAYPHKPISYFCPVACGCRKGQRHCPDSCPSPSASEPACPAFQQTEYADPNSLHMVGAAVKPNGSCPMLLLRDDSTFVNVQP